MNSPYSGGPVAQTLHGSMDFRPTGESPSGREQRQWNFENNVRKWWNIAKERGRWKECICLSWQTLRQPKDMSQTLIHAFEWYLAGTTQMQCWTTFIFDKYVAIPHVKMGVSRSVSQLFSQSGSHVSGWVSQGVSQSVIHQSVSQLVSQSVREWIMSVGQSFSHSNSSWTYTRKDCHSINDMNVKGYEYSAMTSINVQIELPITQSLKTTWHIQLEKTWFHSQVKEWNT